MSDLLRGKRILVTGAASGIGKAAAALFSAEGATLMLSDIQADKLEATAAALGQAWKVCDCTRENEVAALVDACTDSLGGLDGAFNNAGVTGSAMPLEQLSLAAFEKVININLTSVFLCLKYEIRAMKAQGGGAIVNTASGAGVIATPFMADYCASKHGVLGLTKTAAAENARNHIRVNAVLPGTTLTPMVEQTMAKGEEVEKMIRQSVPCGRMGTPEEIAESAAWLLSERASYVSGTSMLVDHAAVCR